jgi:3-oxoacyl-[acyl-carrier protein] reductase
MNLQNSHIVVTGASLGIGRTIAQAVGLRGAKVALVARGVEGLRETQRRILDQGGQAEIFPTDLCDEAAIHKLAADVQTKWGVVDGLLNVAGMWHDGNHDQLDSLFHQLSVKEIDDSLRVNFLAPLLLTRLLLPGMVEQQRGKIIFVSGQFITRGYGHIPYYLGKLGVENLTAGLAGELLQYNIHVNAISPGIVNTEFLEKLFPKDVELAISPEEVAKVALFLLENDIAVHMTGQVILAQDEFLAYNLGKALPESKLIFR